ncbi:hypothetical protein CR513_25168, partial [Mucuna pruriens]
MVSLKKNFFNQLPSFEDKTLSEHVLKRKRLFMSYESKQMENNNRTLEELATLNVLYQPWCIISTQAPEGIPRGLFHDEAARDTGRLYEDEGFPFLSRWSCKRLVVFIIDYVQHLGDMKCMFLGKFFPASKTVTIQKKICGIMRHSGETLHEYWEQFNKLCATCPHHQIRLMMMDKNMINAASGGALMDKTPAVQFETKGVVTTRVVNEVGIIDNLRLEKQLLELTSLVKQLVVEQHQQGA